MDIQELREIIAVVKSKEVSSGKNIFTRDDNTLATRLFRGIEAGEIIDDEGAAMHFYSADSKDKRYMMARLSVYEELVHSLSGYDFAKCFSSYQNSILEAERSLVVMQVLLGLGKRSLATKLARRLYQRTTLTELTDISIKCLRVLRTDARNKGDGPGFDQYSLELERLITLYQKEIRAEEICESVEVPYANSTARKRESIVRATHYLKECTDESHKDITSFQLQMNRLRTQLHLHQVNHEFWSALSLCKDILELLQKNPRFSTAMRAAEFIFIAMKCALWLRNYSLALELGEHCLDLMPPDRPNRIIILTRMFLAAMHSQDYQRALSIYSIASESTAGFTIVKMFAREQWEIYRCYLALLSATGVLSIKGSRQKKEFSVADLMSALPQASKDKKGLNIPVMLFPVLYYIYKKNFDEVSSGIALLDKYAVRHLKKKTHPRSITFLSMLKILRRNKYDPQKSQQKAEALYQELCQTPQDPEQFMESNEIIPYELLWLWVIRRTERKTDRWAIE